jgi:hypothetical protein
VEAAVGMIEEFCGPDHTSNKHIAAAIMLYKEGKRAADVDFDEYVDSLDKLEGRTNNEITAWLDLPKMFPHAAKVV